MKSSIAALALATLAAPVFATVTGSITAGSFDVVLKDLNTTDGVAPGLTWDSNWFFWGGSNVSQQTGYEAVTYSWGQSLEARFGNSVNSGSLVSAPNLSHAGAMLQGTGGFSLQLDAQDRLSLSLQDSATNGVISGASAQFGRGFWLTAGSQVSFSMLVNRSLTGSAYAGSWVQPPNSSAPTFSWANAQMSMSVGSLNTSLSMYSYGTFTNPSAFDVVGEDDPLKLTVRNTTATAQYYWLYVNANTYLQENLDPATAAMVPEPSSYALLAMGLIGVAGMARRRRA